MLLKLDEWWPWYEEMSASFGSDRTQDQRVTDILSLILRNKAVNPRVIASALKESPTLILGAGPSLEKDLVKLRQTEHLSKFVIVAADGATTGLMDVCMMHPEIIVTDLDGKLQDILASNSKGSVMVVHSHGGNMHKIVDYVPRFPKALGTTYVEPRPDVHNFGGFSDGDRAVSLAMAMDADPIVMAGMDIGEDVGKYSKTAAKSREEKKIKLKMCKKVLEWLAGKSKAELYNLTSKGENIEGFAPIDPSDLGKVLNR